MNIEYNLDLRILNEVKVIYNIVDDYFIQKGFSLKVLIFANELELITLTNINRITRKQFISDNINTLTNNETYEIIKNKLIPIIKINNDARYIGKGFLIGLSECEKYLPFNEEVIILKVIGSGDIREDGNIYGYDDIELLLNNNLQNKTYTYFHYVSWNSKETYNKFIFRYDGKIIRSNNYFNKLESKKKSCVFLQEECNYHKKSYDKNETFSLPILFYYILICLSFLKKNGSFIYRYTEIKNDASYQLLYIVSSLFDSFEFLSNEQGHYIKYIKFYNFNADNTILKKLHLVFNKYYNLDNKLGENSIINRELKDNIIFDFNIKVDKDFLFKIYEKNLYFRDSYLNFNKRCVFIQEELNRNPNSIYKFINNLIEKGLKYAKEHNLDINEYYKDYDKKNMDNKLKYKIFPYQKNVNYDNLNFTFETTYSITYPKEAEKISHIIKKNPKIKTITDMTANVGGNSINFCKYFNFVNCVEIDKVTSIILDNNLKEYKFNNYKVFNQNCIDFEEKSDLYFYDPPWGGIFYKITNILDLFLGEKNIVDIIKPNFCLKTPLNFNIHKLILKFPHIEIYRLNNIMIIMNNTSVKSKTLKNKIDKKL